MIFFAFSAQTLSTVIARAFGEPWATILFTPEAIHEAKMASKLYPTYLMDCRGDELYTSFSFTPSPRNDGLFLWAEDVKSSFVFVSI